MASAKKTAKPDKSAKPAKPSAGSDPKGTAEAPARSGPGLLVLAPVVLIASAGASFLLGSAASAPQSTAQSACAPASHEEAARTDAPPEPMILMEVPEILVTIGSQPASRYVKMSVVVGVPEGAEKIYAENETVLMDSFLNYLRVIEPEHFEDPLFYRDMKTELSQRALLALGERNVSGFFVTEFLIR